jgi:hypothetical protein
VLRGAGNRTSLLRVPELIHGFINMTGLSPASHVALVRVAEKTRSLLDAEPRV